MACEMHVHIFCDDFLYDDTTNICMHVTNIISSFDLQSLNTDEAEIHLS